MADEDLQGQSLAHFLELPEAGKLTHQETMDWLQAGTYRELVEIMHFNGRTMPGHRPMFVTPHTHALLRQICRPPPGS